MTNLSEMDASALWQDVKFHREQMKFHRKQFHIGRRQLSKVLIAKAAVSCRDWVSDVVNKSHACLSDHVQRIRRHRKALVSQMAFVGGWAFGIAQPFILVALIQTA